MNFLDSLIGRPNTIRTYKGLFLHHIAPHISPAEIPSFDEQKMSDMVNRWITNDLSPRTIQSLITLLARYIRWAGGPTLEIKQLSRKVGRMKQEEEVKALNKVESRKLVKVCKEKQPDFYPMMMCGLHAGLRRGEVFGLRNGDIDHLKGQIYVKRSYDGATKNGKTRSIPMSKDLSEALLFTATRAVNDRIFPRIKPNPILSNLCRLAKVQEITFHNLRHTFATIALESGISPKQVQRWLGHSNLTTTLNIYWSVIEDTTNMDFLSEE